MSQSDSNTALVPVQSSAIALRGSASFAKRGLGELQLLESAEVWFEKAMNLWLTPNDLTEFFACLQKTVDLNPQHINAQSWMALAYKGGYGVRRDLTLAATWYRKAADQGYPNAQYSLGVMYFQGEGVTWDESQAVAWWRKAAEQGHADAQNSLGAMYSQGWLQDEVQALDWFGRAAAQGLANAQYNLGTIYHFGHGVPVDYAQALAWYKKAAEQGHADAQNNIDSMYRLGQVAYQSDV
jgi:TPR repeat protein